MKKLLNSPAIIRRLALLLVVMLSFVSLAKATPYASGLSNNAGIVSFVLNESADTVKVIFGTTTNNLGALAAGSYTTNVGASNPFKVEVAKNSGTGFITPTAPNVAGKIQISTDPTLAKFNSPRGVAVNRNPASPFFGRIYVANSAAGTAVRAVGDGLYTLKADFSDSPNAYGNTAKTGGFTFTASTSSPYRISVGEDDYVYVSDFSDASGQVVRLDGNLAVGERVLDYVGGIQPLQAPTNHGSTDAVLATGSLANGNLKIFTIDEDYHGADGTHPANSLWEYDINSGPLTNQTDGIFLNSSTFAGANADLEVGPDGKFYVMQTRGNGVGACVFVLDASGNTITNTLDIWRATIGDGAAPDVLSNLTGIAISPNGKFMAGNISSGGGPNGSDTWIIPLVNGIPDLANRMLLDSGAVNQGRDVAFDAAGNLYTVSSGDAVLRAFSPGGFTVTTTGSGGTFDVFVPSTDVSVAATTPVALEAGTVPGVFTITRSVTGTPLTVNFTLSGTATNGIDYVTVPGSVTFAAGAASTNILITPIDDSASEFTETVTLALASSLNYNVVVPVAATLAIVDNDPNFIDITVTQPTMYERLANDYSTFQLTRRGDTNSGLTVNISYSGTAAPGRYNPTLTVNIDPGVVNQTFTISPVDDALLQGDQTIIATVATGTGYTPGSPSSANTTIVDDEVAAETVLFSDNFDTDTTANWTLRHAANNGIDDYSLIFNYDYSANGLPPAPHSGTDTHGVYLTVNKGEGTALGAAGINIYPNGQSFSGDYAVRFDMMLLVDNCPSTTEYALFGINHTGTKTNWFRNSVNGYTNSSYDGLWYEIEADGAALGDYVLNSAPIVNTGGVWGPTAYGSRLATEFTNTFKAPPFFGATGGGAPGNLTVSATPSWVDVEISQIGNVVTLKMDHTTIMRYTNATAFTSGNIMLGFDDAYDSIGCDAAVIYDNLRVINLTAAPSGTIHISTVQIIGGNAQIDFTSTVDEAASLFKLQTSSTITGTFVDNGSAVVTKLGTGSYRATVATSGAVKFYRIKR